ncbi:MAG: YczE/YyaS/YitT family protein [Lachnospiraceae bacterium]
MSRAALFLKQIAIYVTGLLFIAFAVAISISSDLGVSPVNSLPYVVSLITRQEIGTCIVVIYASFIVIQILLLRKEFKMINLTQIIFSFLFGYFTDFAKMVVGDFSIPTYPGKLLMLTVSIVLIAFGVALYVDAKLVNMPMEGLTQAISQKILKGKPFHEAKVIVDCAVVIIAALSSLIFLGKLDGVREGTVISALVVGKVMKPIQKVLVPALDRYVFKK